ncbi:DUF2489 domain-containing protein [Marinobacter zhejiangensis]|uniref:DUF2489 domain-containing protein n=1 Tax=Marinobacter zhejiangensis TaxID=488535 RepID=A0A1I4MHC1_9GAMM|nr:DUF2489 domain-containing protein [Marinobacter zhejiangensis]SFM02446.1 Protein of unknown function [Marinobacter zhejiangensis]
MPQWLQWVLIAAGLIAISLLLVFIVRQFKVLKTERARREKQMAFHAERRSSIVESLRLLALAIEEDQVEYSEACLRINGLLELVEPELLTRPPYNVFAQVHEQLRHMPTHKAREETDKRFIRKLDKERFAIETRHAEAIRQAAAALRHHPF